MLLHKKKASMLFWHLLSMLRQQFLAGNKFILGKVIGAN
jgi:hypothetical protein